MMKTRGNSRENERVVYTAIRYRTFDEEIKVNKAKYIG